MKIGDKVRPTEDYIQQVGPSEDRMIYEGAVVTEIRTKGSWPIIVKAVNGREGCFDEHELEVIFSDTASTNGISPLNELAQYFAKYADQKFPGDFVANEIYRIIRNR